MTCASSPHAGMEFISERLFSDRPEIRQVPPRLTRLCRHRSLRSQNRTTPQEMQEQISVGSVGRCIMDLSVNCSILD